MNSRLSTPWIRLAAVIGTVFTASSLMPGCTSPPRDPDNLCSIFGQKHAWYRTTLATQRRWGIDQATQMAVIFQESSFRAGARPPRTKLLGFIPWRRQSSAYGYAQVVDGTWDVYRREAVRPRAERNRFADATDFIGWYMSRIAKRAQIDKTSARSLYLAYHEGAGGFQRGTHLKKKWLLDISYRVAQRTARYRAQLELCRERLERYRWWWPF